jgi:RNA polymerase sigma factor (sigma-70 family)
MAGASAGDIGRQLGRLFGTGTAVGLTDGELIRQFAARRDESAEAAFETILARHGAMVLSVCRQVLGDPHAAEDAFQATFLVLVRRAGSLRVREPGSIGPWLYGVAYRIALKARQAAGRRRARERRVARPTVAITPVALEDGEFRAMLHDEVNRLPTKYQAPVVLCYFEGRSHDEAAAALGWPIGTVHSRLNRARDRLRSRLTRRGLAPAGLAGGSLLESIARAEVPAALRTATVAAAIAGETAPAIAAMVKLLLRSLLLARVKMVATALGVILMASSVGLTLRDSPASQPPPSRGPDPPRTAVDRFGDRLPEFAHTRMGTIRFHDGNSVRKVLHTPDGKLLVTLAHGIIRVWEAATGRLLRDVGDSKIHVWGIALSPDGKTLATIELPSRLRLWDLATGRERRRWHEVKDQEYRDLAFAPDGQKVAVSVRRYDPENDKYENFIDLWDAVVPSEHRRRIVGDWLMLRDLAFSPDGKLLATASDDSRSPRADEKPAKGSTRLWDITTGQERRRFPVEGGHVQSLAFSPGGRLLAAAATDGTTRLYDLTTGQERTLRSRPEPASLPSQPEVTGCLAFSPDGSILAAGSAGSDNPGDAALATIHLWDVIRGQEVRRIPAHPRWVASLSFAPDGQTLASTGAEPVIRIWDVATGREAFPQSGHRSAVRSLAACPADGTVFTGGSDGTIRQWDPASGREIGIIARFADLRDSWALAPDGKTLLVGGGSGGAIALWSVADRREIRRFPQIKIWNPLHFDWSPDGKTTIAEGHKRGRAWDVATGQVVVELQNPDPLHPLDGNSPIFYSPDGRQVITVGRGGARNWDATTGKEVGWAIRSDHIHAPVVISADRRFLATGGLVVRGRIDPPIRLWELISGQEVVTLPGHGQSTRGLALSLDGRLLVSCIEEEENESTSGPSVRVWDLVSARELRRFRGHRGAVNAVAFTPDGRSVVTGSEDATALVWDVSDLIPQRQPEPLTAESLRARWDELAGIDARAAYRAAWTLSVPSAVAFLRDHLKPATAAEPITSPEVLRTLRAITALERIRTPEARAVIERLAQDDQGAIATREARSTLDRLDRPVFSSRPTGR